MTIFIGMYIYAAYILVNVVDQLHFFMNVTFRKLNSVIIKVC